MRNAIVGFAVLVTTLLAGNLKAQDSTNYFPLHVGDFWRYKGDETIWSGKSINDSVSINEQKYYLREWSPRIPASYFGEAQLDTVRTNDSLAVVFYAKGTDYPFYKFDVSVGDTWSYPDWPWQSPFDTIRYVVTFMGRLDSFSISSGPMKGAYRNVLVYFRDRPGAYDAWSYDYLAPGLGLIYRNWYLDQRILYGAVINGKLYGDTTTTGIKGKGTPIPQSFQLLQNYPNPFNPTTVIKYNLPERTFVDLSVYDVLGRKVKTLVRGFREAGTYEAKLEGGDMPSGIYLYRLVAGQDVLVRKAVLVK